MTKAVSLTDIQADKERLLKAFIKDKAAYYAAQKKLNASKVKLTKFNDRYGRVLQMMDED